jgi:hypothetical protein
VLDTLKKEYRRTSTAHRGQHKTQRGVGVFVVVDIENFLRSPKTFHQSRELTPIAQTVDLESHRQMAMLNTPTMECDRVNLRRSVPVQKRQQIFETVPVRHRGHLFRMK